MQLLIDIITLFPEMFEGPFNESILRRAQDKKLVRINIHDLRKWGIGERRTVDGKTYGGGIGMVLRVDVVARAIEEIKNQRAKAKIAGKNSKVVLLTPSGKKFTQEKAREYSKLEHLVLIAGHYEGFDERIAENLADEEISIGDYILTGGEIPAMVITDAVSRLIPGVLTKEKAPEIESFSDPNLVEYPQYTRPEEFNGSRVPEILLSGNHREIENWRREKALEKTKKNRPDL
jgi:tRNA (guanine37-N1)-methyltransferase